MMDEERLDAILKMQPRHRVEAALNDLIATLAPGSQLPPEPQLAQQLGTSRATLREVIRSLVERGVLVRRHGVGTFVASRLPFLESGLEVLESLDRLAKRNGLNTDVLKLTISERPATAFERQGLAWGSQEEGNVLVVDRVIAVAGTPVADLRDIVPLLFLSRADLGPNFHGSVLDVLLQRGTPLLSFSRTDIMAESARPDIARRLQVPRGTAVLKLVAQLYSIDERIVDFSVSYFLPGYFKFHVIRKSAPQ